MTYKEFIQNIIDTRGQWNIPDGVCYEKHHIIPKCMGGKGDYDSGGFKKKSTHPNCIYLTIQEHYEAHKLLFEENPDSKELAYVWWSMTNVRNKERPDGYIKVDEDAYIKLRERFIASLSGENNPMYGRVSPNKGVKFYNNGKVEIQSKTPPDGEEWVEGKLPKKWYTDGVNDFFRTECPVGCVPGRCNVKHKYTNGVDIVLANECPDGYFKANKEFVAKNLHWYNNGVEEIYAIECPDGWEVGRILFKIDTNSSEHKKDTHKTNKHWYNNGKEDVRCETCPEGWVQGRLHNSSKGKHYYTNGKEEIFSDTCPDGWWLGKAVAPKLKGTHFYTNGKDEIRAYDCPDGWWLGRCDSVREKQRASRNAYLESHNN